MMGGTGLRSRVLASTAPALRPGSLAVASGRVPDCGRGQSFMMGGTGLRSLVLAGHRDREGARS